MRRTLSLLLAAGLAGCASSPAVPDKAEPPALIVCDGKPKPPPALRGDKAKQQHARQPQARKAMPKQQAAGEPSAPASTAPTAAPSAPAPGRFEVKLLSPKDGEQPAEGERRLSLIAEAVPLRDLAPRLSEVLGVNVALEPSLAGRRVWLWMPDVTLRGLQRTLLDEYEIASTQTKGVLLLQPKAKASRAPALQTRIVELEAASAEPAQLARLWCRMFATRRGSAAVLGRTIVFEDSAEGLSYAEALAARWGGSVQPLLPAKNAASQPPPAK